MDKKHDFSFVDLFAGIGGFHLALHELGGKCVFASEWNEKCKLTYESNFKAISPNLFLNKNYSGERFTGDITKVEPESIPDHDLLAAGFPCQPFSQAGYKLGFEDTRGTLFFNIAEILKIKRPKAYILENVRGLLKHDNGKTIKVIENTLIELGYSFNFRIIKASDFNLPQHRPRIFIVGFRNDLNINTFKFPEPIPLEKSMSDIFEGKHVNKKIGFTLRVGGKGSSINDKRNWDSYLVNGIVTRITPKEGLMMQGFPKNFYFPVSNNEAMKQLGNSVAIPVVKAVAKMVIENLKNNDKL